jgi:hypothetical protein
VASPAAGVDFDRDRLSTGELIAGIAGLVLLIDLWFKWYGVNVSAGGALQNFQIGVSANAWQSFGVIDIILFLVALIAIGVAVLRGLDRLPDMPYPPASLLTVAGGIAFLLIVYRTIDTPVDTHGVNGIDVSRKFGLWLGLLSAAAITYGGWRAMQESGASFGGLADAAAGGGAGGGAAGATAPTMPMPAADAGPGVPGGGAAGVSPGKEGPGAPHPGTSTGAPGEEGEAPPPPAAGADPVPGQNAPATPPGLAGEPPAGRGTQAPGL